MARLKRVPRTAAVAGALLVGLLPAPGVAGRAAAVPAFVDVAVATVWTSPEKPRPIDAPALGNPVHMQRWLANMDTAQRLALTADNATQTQVLYGRRVLILARRDGWDEIAVPGQPTPKNPLGYPGWVPAGQLTRSPSFAALRRRRPFAQVDGAPVVWLYDDAARAQPFMQVSFGTRLPVLGRDTRHQAIEVATPAEGPKWLAGADATVYDAVSDIAYPTGPELVRTAERFLGVDYVWGGRSGWMLDCSGLVGLVYGAHGIVLPRDADPQAVAGGGRRVAGRGDRTAQGLRPGDLLFYARSDGAGRIDHTAIYAGGGRMIEAYNAGTPVRVTPARFGAAYWGAVRYLHP